MRKFADVNRERTNTSDDTDIIRHNIHTPTKRKVNNFWQIYAIIVLKSVCRSSQTAGRNSCSFVSGDMSNWSYQLPLTSSHLSLA